MRSWRRSKTVGEPMASEIPSELLREEVDAVDLPRFSSFSEMRAEHTSLLEEYYGGNQTAPEPEVLERITRFIQRGRRTGLVLDRDDERWDAQALLNLWSTILYRAQRSAPLSRLALFDPAVAGQELDEDQCPYVGLRAFDYGDRPWFFGREGMVADLTQRLAESPILAVVGMSGTGKSSLVLAGLLPALRHNALSLPVPPGPDEKRDTSTVNVVPSGSWRYFAPLVPGADPLQALATSVAGPEPAEANASAGGWARSVPPGEERGAWIERLAAELRREPARLRAVVGGPDSVPAVFVVDQFEELFTLCTDEAARQAFIANLLSLLANGSLHHRILLTMRVDYQQQVGSYQELQQLLAGAKVLVSPTPFSSAELRAAIEKPAEAIGLRFDEGLVEALVQEVIGEPAGLPLLQFALLKLWEHRERNRITWTAYHEVGGPLAALGRSASGVYDGLLPEDRRVADRIFLRLVRLGPLHEILRNRVRRSDLSGVGTSQRVEHVLTAFECAHLLRRTPGRSEAETQYEVLHEALPRNWDHLATLVEEEAERLRERQRLTEMAQQWTAQGRDSDRLLRGSLLEEAERHDDLNSLEQEFVRTSRDAVELARRREELLRFRQLALLLAGWTLSLALQLSAYAILDIRYLLLGFGLQILISVVGIIYLTRQLLSIRARLRIDQPVGRVGEV